METTKRRAAHGRSTGAAQRQRRGGWRLDARLAGIWLMALAVVATACGGIPPFPGTGAAPTSAPATPKPAATPNLQATVDAAVRATQQAAPQPAGSPGALAPPPLTPPTGPAPASTPSSGGPLLPIPTTTSGSSILPNLLGKPTANPAATAAPGSGAPSPEAAVQRAYEAAARGDDATLKALTDPGIEGSGSPLQALGALGRLGGTFTLNDMRYEATQNDGTVASVRVTGRLGNIPVVGERAVDVTETARKIGDAWYVSRATR